jgi:arsenite-transporting ATPase
LSEVDREGKYKHIVVDTAPSGHTSRLLRLPEVFARIVHTLDVMGEKHRYMIEQFARRKAPVDRVELFLRDLTERIASVRKLLYDEEQTSFTLVTIPEAMSVRETERYLELLKEQGVPVRDVIVNRVEQEHDECKYCHARVMTQKRWLKEIGRVFKGMKIHSVPLMPQEVRGLEALKEVGNIIWKASSH